MIMTKLTTDEIVTMCERLSYKYNSGRHRQDLEMEGVLTCYEILAQEPDAHPAKLYREAKRRMHDYLNLDTQPVAIPKHSRSRRLTRNIDDSDAGDMSEEGYDWLKSVLSSSDVPYDEDYGVCDKDHTVEYERKEYDDRVRAVAEETLSTTELCIIKLRYYQDLSQDAVSVVLETNKMWVSRHERVALEKLKKGLM